MSTLKDNLEVILCIRISANIAIKTAPILFIFISMDLFFLLQDFILSIIDQFYGLQVWQDEYQSTDEKTYSFLVCFYGAVFIIFITF